MELRLRICSWLLKLLLIILTPFYWYRDYTKPPKLPTAKNPLLNFTAKELAKRIRNKQISSESVVKAFIDRIEEVNPLINAVVENRFDAALLEAKECDKMIETGEVTASQLEIERPLFGVPFTVKESCGLKGLSHTGCTRVREGIKADEDSLIVQSMRNAGAIPLCVTNTPEICSGFESTNPLYGTTCNPYDTRHSAGGSSGGEGALIGAGASLIGIGSDIAGSIRVPALFNGIFGHKPTPGIIPIKGHYPMVDNKEFQYFLTLGPLARSVDDLHLAVKIMSANCNKKLDLDEPVDVSKLKVFYIEDVEMNFGLIPVEVDIKSAIKRAAMHLKNVGASVTNPTIPELSDTAEIASSFFFNMTELPPILVNPNDPKTSANPWWEFLKASTGCSIYSKSAIFTAAVTNLKGLVPQSEVSVYIKKGHHLKDKILKMLGNDGVLLYPTFISSAPRFGQLCLMPIAGIHCLLWNVFGFPITQVPNGLDKNGLPIGFQVIAAPHQDRLCLAVAKECEKAFGGWIPPS